MRTKRPLFPTLPLTELLLVAAGILAAALFARLLSSRDWWIVTYLPAGGNRSVFVFFSFFGAINTLIVGLLLLRSRLRKGAPGVVSLLGFTATLLYFFLWYQNHQQPWDYLSYEYAAKALLDGAHPYSHRPHLYLYPPLLAYLIAGLYKIVAWFGLFDPWQTVFYLYECCRFLFLALCYFFLYHFARLVGATTALATGLCVALFVLNEPLRSTLQHSQINLVVLATMLVAALLWERAPAWGGLSLAVGAHLKLWPLVLLPGFIARRRLPLVVYAAVCAALLFLFVAVLPGGTEAWTEFSGILRDFPEDGTAFRNSSLDGLYRNIGKLIGLSPDSRLLRGLTLLSKLAAIAWLLKRLQYRERLFRRSAETPQGRPSGHVPLQHHIADLAVLPLLLAPSVWEHHFVLTMPLIVICIVELRRSRLWPALLGACLVLALPTVDLFPLSYHRLVGLLLLLSATRPSSLSQRGGEAWSSPRASTDDPSLG